MPSTFPCPNPVCSQVFNADAVQGAARLVCPRCGTKFEFGPRPAARPAAAAPKAAPAAPPNVAAASAKPVRPAAPVKPTAPPPMARPAVPVRAAPPPPSAKPAAKPPPLPVAAPAVPMAVPVEVAPEPSSALAFGSTPDVVLTPRRRRSLPGWLTAALLIVPVFGAVAGLVLWATYAGYTFWNTPGPGSPLAEEQANGFVAQGNFRLTPPAPPWKQDTALQKQMYAALAYRRTKPSGAMALAFQDYKTRLPRDAELIDDALGKLHTYLINVEYEIKPKGEQKLGGQPALSLEFTGEDPEHVLVEGECLAVAYRGFGYWFYAWGPQDEHDNLTAEWDALRQNFAPGAKREDWTEAPRKTLTITGGKLPYKLDYAEEVWHKQELDGYDPRADAVLLGYDPKDKEARSGVLTATVQVLALEKAKDLADAVKTAREHLLEMEKEKQADAEQYTYPGATMEVVTDKALPNADNDADVGGFRGHITKFEVKKSADQQKYVVLAVVRQEGGGLAVVCECAWGRRDYWEQEFAPLLAKLRPVKGK